MTVYELVVTLPDHSRKAPYSFSMSMSPIISFDCGQPPVGPLFGALGLVGLLSPIRSYHATATHEG